MSSPDTIPYLINLDKRHDRLQNMTRRLKNLNLDFIRFPGIIPQNKDRFPNIGHHGCALSHLSVWKKGLIDHKGQNILIMEDDILLRGDFINRTNDALKCLEETPWSLLYLGVKVKNNQKQRKYKNNVYYLDIGYHFHCYIVNGDKAGNLIERFEKEYRVQGDQIPIDILANNFPEVRKFFYDPILAVQCPDMTDIDNREMNRLDEYFGYFDRNEFRENCEEFRELGL